MLHGTSEVDLVFGGEQLVLGNLIEVQTDCVCGAGASLDSRLSGLCGLTQVWPPKPPVENLTFLGESGNWKAVQRTLGSQLDETPPVVSNQP